MRIAGLNGKWKMGSGKWEIETKKIIMSSALTRQREASSLFRTSIASWAAASTSLSYPTIAIRISVSDYSHQDICRLSCRHDVNCMYVCAFPMRFPASARLRIGIDIHTICIIEVSEKLQRM